MIVESKNKVHIAKMDCISNYKKNKRLISVLSLLLGAPEIQCNSVKSALAKSMYWNNQFCHVTVQPPSLQQSKLRK